MRSFTRFWALLSLTVASSLAGSAHAQPWSHILVEPRAEEMFASADASVRLRAIELLTRYGDPRSTTALLRGVLGRSAGVEERVAIIRALARMGRPEAVAAFAEARRFAPDRELLLALSSYPTDESMMELVSALSDASAAVDAHDALLRVGARSVPRLIRALRDPVLVAPAAKLLGEIGDRRALLPLINLLDSANVNERREAVNALALMRDDRAVPALLAHRADSDRVVRHSILNALGALGTRDARGLFEAAVRGEDSDAASIAIVAWMKVEPSTARVEVARLLAGPATPLREAARTQLLQSTDPSWVDLLAAELSRGQDLDLVAFALVRIERGEGLAALVSALDTSAARFVYMALGVCVRTWDRFLSSSARADAQRALVRHRELVDPDLSLTTRALARDRDAQRWLERGLRSPMAKRRAQSALGLELLGEASALSALLSCIVAESDAEAFRREAMAILSFSGDVDSELLFRHLGDLATGPEALLLLAQESPSLSDRARRLTREAMRRALRSADPRTRAAGARALALAHDVEATGALLHALDDRSREVRLASARALATFPLSDAHRTQLRALARTETDDELFSLLQSIADGYFELRHDTRMMGTRVLITRWVNNVASSSEANSVDLVLNDGRWLRMVPGTDGFLVLADLVSGSANVFFTPRAVSL